MTREQIHQVFIFFVPFLIFLLCYFVFSYFYSSITGWKALAQRYRSTWLNGFKFRVFWSALRHPSLSYQYLITLYLSDDGLGLKVIPGSIFRHPPLKIPWSDIRYVGDRKYLWVMTLSQFTLGSPPITSLFLWKKDLDNRKLWEQIQPRLGAPLIRPVTPTAVSKASARGQVALIFAIVSFFGFGFVTGIPAIILGFKEQRAIDRGEVPGAGRKIAKTAWILGLMGTLLWFLIDFGITYLSTHSP